MKTPICDFVSQYKKRGFVRAHMPGHKGSGVIESFDITEIPGADSLYEANGIIKQSESFAGSFFGAHTFFGTEGSSQCIRAMIWLVSAYAKSKNQEPIILAARNVHRSFVSGAAMVGCRVEWMYSREEQSFLSCRIDPQSVEEMIKKHNPSAVYLTSPDYLGNLQDVEGISAVCKKHGVLCVVDNAHGAYLKFLPQSHHPMDLGADVCCDSAHKTLPVLTGGAYLHVSKSAPCFLSENAKEAMSIFGSTSPSYIILQSLDNANVYLQSAKKRMAVFLPQAEELKSFLVSMGHTLTGDEPLKITVSTKKFGYEGTEFAKLLEKNGVMCEYADPDHLVLMLTPKNKNHLDIIKNAFLQIEKRNPITKKPPVFVPSQAATDIRSAMMSPRETVGREESRGRIAADSGISCPPAVPVLISGEIISDSAVECMRYYGIETVRVLIDQK